jgi:aspartate/methionine/tyrosine aminotransferase
MIVINNPNNPTGATIPESVLAEVVRFAHDRGIIVLSDEVYRPLFHGLKENEIPPSILSMGYTNSIATGSMSKAYSLAGIRLGWIASRDKSLLNAVTEARDFTTISVSQVDDQIASFALSDSVLPSLMKRNLDLARTNASLLEEFIWKHRAVCSWLRPSAGTTAFVQFKKEDRPVDDTAFCLDVLNKTKVLLLPGSRCFGNGNDFKGFVRFGYVCETDVLREALKRLGKYVQEHIAAE